MPSIEDVIELDELPSKKAITEDDLVQFFRCPHSFLINQYLGLTKIPISAFAVQSLIFKNMRRSLYKIGETFSKTYNAGPDLKNIEHMNKDELKLYLNARSKETYGGTSIGKWNYFARIETFGDLQINWSYPGQKFFGGKQLDHACKNYYDFVINNGVPFIGMVEEKFTFNFEGNKFTINIPELRKGLIIDDPTLQGFSKAIPGDSSDNPLETSIMVTLRTMGLIALLRSEYNSEHFMLKFNVERKLADKILEKNSVLLPEIVYRHINCTTKQIRTTVRDDNSLDRLKSHIDNFLYSVEKQEYPTNHRHCIECSFNTLDIQGKVSCSKVRKNTMPSVPYYYMKKSNFSFKTEAKSHLQIFTGQIENSHSHQDVVRYELQISKPNYELEIYSSFPEGIRGFEFEEQIMKEAHLFIAETANKSNEPILHRLSFPSSFDGIKSAKEFLMKSGYHFDNEHFIKKYLPKPTKKSKEKPTFLKKIFD